MKVFTRKSYYIENIEIKPSQSYLIKDGQQIYLRQKLMQVLVYLIEQRYQIVTKEELIENVWKGAFITDDTLAQSIKEVRKVLGDNPRQSRSILIFTLPSSIWGMSILPWDAIGRQLSSIKDF